MLTALLAMFALTLMLSTRLAVLPFGVLTLRRVLSVSILSGSVVAGAAGEHQRGEHGAHHGPNQDELRGELLVNHPCVPSVRCLRWGSR